MGLEHTPTSAGTRFVNFTKSRWVSSRAAWTEGIEKELGEVSNLDSAKEFWRAGSILNCLKAVRSGSTEAESREQSEAVKRRNRLGSRPRFTSPTMMVSFLLEDPSGFHCFQQWWGISEATIG